MMRISCKKALPIFIIIVFGLLYFCIYRNAILTSDDYRYMFSRFDGELVVNIKGAFISFFAEYLNWSGRLAHFFDIILLLSRGNVWRLLTPLLLACTPFLLFYFFYLKIPETFCDYVKIFIGYFIMATFGDLYTVQMLYWHTACVTYFYMPLLMIVFLIPFRKKLSNFEYEFNRFYFVIELLIGFCLGMSQEVVGAISVAFVAFTVIYRIINKQSVSKYDFIVLLFTLLGFVLLICAPGNSIRQAMPTFAWWTESNTLGKIKHGLGQFIFNQYHVQYLIVICLLVSMYLSLNKKNRYVKNIVFIVLILISLFLVVLACGDNFISWDFLEKWKYTQGYFYMNKLDIFFPAVFYILLTLFIYGVSVLISIERKDVIPFLIISAVFCSNLTVMFSSVGTSYISFPGVLLTIGLIIYLFPDVNNKKLGNLLICFSILICLINFSKESSKMSVISNEEKNRLEKIEESLENKQGQIILSHYTQKVWEGDYISEEYRKYYSIPEYVEVVVE